MPSFYFHALDGDHLFEDPGGSDLPDLEAARAGALAAARGAAAEQIRSRQGDGRAQLRGHGRGRATSRGGQPPGRGGAASNRPEDRLAQAERQIREGGERVARQAAVLEGFELVGDERAAEQAGETLAVMRTGLALALLCMSVELMWTDDGPDRPARKSS